MILVTHLSAPDSFSGCCSIIRGCSVLSSNTQKLRENEMPKERHTFNFLSQYLCDCWWEIIWVWVKDLSHRANLMCRHVPGEQINVIGTRVITLRSLRTGQEDWWRGLPECLHWPPLLRKPCDLQWSLLHLIPISAERTLVFFLRRQYF